MKENVEEVTRACKEINLQTNVLDGEILQTKHVNEHGETMILKSLDDATIMFYHNDCNDSFEKIPLNSLKSFKYTLTNSEKVVFKCFVESTIKLLGVID